MENDAFSCRNPEQKEIGKINWRMGKKMNLLIQKKYLKIPLKYQWDSTKLKFYENRCYVLDIDVPYCAEDPDYYAYLPVYMFLNKEIGLVTDPEVSFIPEFVDEIRDEHLYHEKNRPNFHFTPKIGWMNDPNGLVYLNGAYHMFFQYNPAGHGWRNMSWGHAVSKDLIHWEEEDCAIFPDATGYICSGSAIIDHENLTGLKENENDVLLLYYTACGKDGSVSDGAKAVQCMAYSVDGAKTFHKYQGNPLVSHIENFNRDPNVNYVPELGCYVMALYLDDSRYILFRSDDLLHWEKLQLLDLKCDGECPDLYPLFLDQNPEKQYWIFSGACNSYIVGNFKDGKYVYEEQKTGLRCGRNSYAAQTFAEMPDRRVWTAWNTYLIENSCFTACMCFPSEVTLKTIDGEAQLCLWPIDEIKQLYEVSHTYESTMVTKSHEFSSPLDGISQDVQMTIKPMESTNADLNLLGIHLEFDFQKMVLIHDQEELPLHLREGEITIRMLIDTTSLEVYSDAGQHYLCHGMLCDGSQPSFTLAASDSLQISRLQTSSIRSIWGN